MHLSATSPLTPSAKPHGEMPVTQAISFVFYTMLFVLAWLRYDPLVHGLGLYSPEEFKPLAGEESAKVTFRAYLFLVVGINALRYYWSALLVEADPSFHAVRATLSKCYKRIEYALRIACFIILYSLPLILTPHKRGHNLELLLLLLYGLLVSWDLIFRFAGTYSDDQASFKSSVNWWLGTEVLGLITTLIYILVIIAVARDKPLTALLITLFLAFMFLAPALIDIIKHKKTYLQKRHLIQLLICFAAGILSLLIIRP